MLIVMTHFVSFSTISAPFSTQIHEFWTISAQFPTFSLDFATICADFRYFFNRIRRAANKQKIKIRGRSGQGDHPKKEFMQLTFARKNSVHVPSVRTCPVRPCPVLSVHVPSVHVPSCPSMSRPSMSRLVFGVYFTDFRHYRCPTLLARYVQNENTNLIF